ncbi:MAG: hypothetical protein U9O96_04670 [Candidatus Thermoplasmatota archaeon]|nr:hypothetical protein [Candidatus Thermoplasmatota archaeon]
METKNKISIIAVFILILITSVLLYYWWVDQNGEREPSAVLDVDHKSFTIYEGNCISICLSFKSKENYPIATDVEWEITAAGDTGKITYPPGINVSATNLSGMLSAVYHAPDDVDVMNHTVKIVARTAWQGEKYTAEINGTVQPILHKTRLSLSCSRKKMIAGETAIIKATLMGYVNQKWQPMANKTIEWAFFGKENNTATLKKLGERKSVTNYAGKSEIPFFLSDANDTMNIICSAKFEQNLSGDVDYTECSRLTNVTVVPEKPGDFPVVLIHGWIVSSTDWLLNYTWWNLTQKLEQRGFKILDFDISKPGIQYLTYDPDWKDRHIPWIAARVNDEIEKALVLNGYSPNQTIDIVAHSMGGLVSRFTAEHGGADVDYWNDSWMPGDEGCPWYGDGDPDINIGGEQIDDLIVVGTPCHGVPPGINSSILKIIGYLYFPWWIGQVPDMIYNSKFLEAMGYRGTDMVDYYAVGGDIGFIFGMPMDFDGDGTAHTSDGLCPTESSYLEGKPLYIVEGKAWPNGNADHVSLTAINDDVHEYIISKLV